MLIVVLIAVFLLWTHHSLMAKPSPKLKKLTPEEKLAKEIANYLNQIRSKSE